MYAVVNDSVKVCYNSLIYILKGIDSMEKYKNYLGEKGHDWLIAIGLCCALLALLFVIVDMQVPIDAAELQKHYEQLEMVKEDTSSIYLLEDATIKLEDSGMTVEIKGERHILEAFFDENNEFINAIIRDNRIGSSITFTLIFVLFGFSIGYMSSCILLLILLTPVMVYELIKYIKKKITSKKDNKKL